MGKLMGFILILCSCSWVFGADVDTVSTYSPSMNKNIKAVVVTPENYSKDKEFPVVYLLHGYSGSYKEWVKNAPGILEYADRYGMIVVSPDGNYNSWYFDSPLVPESKYETYISKELVEWIDSHYNTIANRDGRAITGLSMGGHGSLYLAFKHQDVYATVGSMSGGVDIRPFPNNWEISKYLGSYSENPGRWNDHSVINLIHLINPQSLDIIIECGTDDFFYDVNVRLHEKLLYYNIPHTFTSSPGGHTWDFWRKSIKYQMEFFNSHFKSIEK